MKRCPQCEFIYEDDQSLCDMDGVLLVLDSRTLPNLHALATVPAKSQKRTRTVPAVVPAFATLILVLVLGMVYYGSTQRNASTPQSFTSTSNPAPEMNPTPAVEPSVAEQPPAPAKEVEEAKPTVIKPTAAPVKKPTAKSASSTQTKTSTEPKKEDSKVNSILKKTGRILKKPFKF